MTTTTNPYAPLREYFTDLCAKRRKDLPLELDDLLYNDVMQARALALECDDFYGRSELVEELWQALNITHLTSLIYRLYSDQFDAIKTENNKTDLARLFISLVNMGSIDYVLRAELDAAGEQIREDDNTPPETY